jgi:hypothetical protein
MVFCKLHGKIQAIVLLDSWPHFVQIVNLGIHFRVKCLDSGFSFGFDPFCRQIITEHFLCGVPQIINDLADFVTLVVERQGKFDFICAGYRQIYKEMEWLELDEELSSV